MDRRKFLASSGFALGSGVAVPLFGGALSPDLSHSSGSVLPGTWEAVRSSFKLSHKHIQMAQMLFASHPEPVRQSIRAYTDRFDEDPAIFWEENWVEAEERVNKAARDYTGAAPGEIALTDSTTQGLGLLYSGLKLRKGDEILTTTHDHYSTEMSLDYAAAKSGAVIRRIDEYKDPARATTEEITGNIARAITKKTRIVAVTWVHSCDGVKLPIKAIAEVIRDANESRSPGNRIYFCVDGVHGFGNQDDNIPDLGCDFFVAGTHKWLFGPRGTGLIWARRDAWDMLEPSIPAFQWNPFVKWLGREHGEITFGDLHSPGGFHAFEHRWSLDKAFEFSMNIGREKIYQRTTELSTRLKEGIAGIPKVTLLTPTDPHLSAGINAFIIGELSADESVKAFHEEGIIASASPYTVSYVRLTPCVINTTAEVDACLEAVRRIAGRA